MRKTCDSISKKCQQRTSAFAHGEVNNDLLHRFAFPLRIVRIHALDGISSEFNGFGKLCGVDIYSNNLRSTDVLQCSDSSEADTAETKNSRSAARLALTGTSDGTIASGDTTPEQAHLVERCGLVDHGNCDLWEHGVLREGGDAHEVENGLAIGVRKAGSAVGHHTFTLGGTNGDTQVGLARFAELAVAALRRVQRHDVIADLDTGNTLADGLDDTRSFVAENAGENALRIMTAKGVQVRVAHGRSMYLDTDLNVVEIQDVRHGIGDSFYDAME